MLPLLASENGHEKAEALRAMSTGDTILFASTEEEEEEEKNERKGCEVNQVMPEKG